VTIKPRFPDLWAAVLAAPVVWGTTTWLWPNTLPRGDWAEATWTDILHLIVLTALYPALEEWVFRGQLQGWLLEQPWGQRRFGPVSIANTLTSLIFALLHLVSQPPLLAILVFFPSLVFGYARERTSGLIWPIGLHSWYNLGWFWLQGPG